MDNKNGFSGQRETAAPRETRFFLIATMALVLSGYVLVFSARAATAAKQTGSVSSAQTNTVSTNLPVIVEIPKSVFIWNPKEPGFGRDPFFPTQSKAKDLTVSPSQPTTVFQQSTTPPEPPKPKPDFVLNGLIGKLVCIVNGRQIMVGNTEMIPTAAGKVKVRCDKIEGEKAFITIFLDNGTTETRELSLKTEK